MKGAARQIRGLSDSRLWAERFIRLVGALLRGLNGLLERLDGAGRL